MSEPQPIRESGTSAQSAPTPPALALAGVSHSFGARKALDDVSFSIKAGAFTVLLGHNGAGKTTLFSLVTRLYSNRSGSIRVYDFEVRRHPAAALSVIGAVFQQRTLDVDLTVGQNLRYQAALRGMNPRDAKRRIETELDRVNMLDRINDRVRNLSGGQVRRVEIAGALLHRPRLLLLDEPTVGLDIGSRPAILDHVHRLCREDGLGVLWATHLIDEVAPGDRVIVLHQGRILADGTTEEVMRAAGAATIGEAFGKLTAAGKR